MRKLLSAALLLAVLALSGSASASTYYHVYEPLQMKNGEAVSGAHVYVYQPNTTTGVNIYTNANADTLITQPTHTSSLGMMSFYVAPGIYDIRIDYDAWNIDSTWQDWYVPGISDGISMFSLTTGVASAGVTSSRYMSAGGATMTAHKGIVMTRDGSIVGLGMGTAVTSSTSTPTLVPAIRINGVVAFSDTVSVTANTGLTCYKTASAGTYEFDAGDTLTTYLTVNGTVELNQVIITAECLYDR